MESILRGNTTESGHPEGAMEDPGYLSVRVWDVLAGAEHRPPRSGLSQALLAYM
jgi:hypothetical protein